MILDDYKKFLLNGYYDEDGVEKNELFLKYPMSLATEFAIDKNISYGQLRTIFNQINALSLKLKLKQITYKESYNTLSVLYSKINDKYNKGILNKSFLDFFEININLLKEERDVYCFTKHFQCICNFYPKENKQVQHNNDYKKNNTPRNNSYNNYGGKR